MTEAETSRMIRQYLDECASSCICCRTKEDRVRRLRSESVLEFPLNARPILRLPCYCRMCGAEWFEVYRLETAEILNGSMDLEGEG